MRDYEQPVPGGVAVGPSGVADEKIDREIPLPLHRAPTDEVLEDLLNTVLPSLGALSYQIVT